MRTVLIKNFEENMYTLYLKSIYEDFNAQKCKEYKMMRYLLMENK